MSKKSTLPRGQSSAVGALLALLVVSILALPAGEMARGWAATAATSSDSPSAMSQTATSSPSPSNLLLGPFDLRLDGNSLLGFTPSPIGNAAGQSLKEFSVNARNSGAFPLFNARPLFDHGTNGAPSVENTQPQTKHGVRKKYLALGILGVLGAAGGVVAVAGSNSVCTTNNIGNNGTAKSICSNVHTAGEVIIPAGAAVAVLGFYLAYRRH